MKKALFTFIISLILSVSGMTQERPADSDSLNKQIVPLFQQGKFDEAIPLAEKVVENEKRTGKDSEFHAAALVNLALLHKERLRREQANVANSKSENIAKSTEKIVADADDAEDLLRDALKIYEKLSKGETLPAAAARIELAWVLNNFISPMANAPARVRIDEAEKLYTETLATQERLAGNDSGTTLKTVLALGDFYVRWINFEKALPFYERYISAVEKKQGVSSKALVPALRANIEILVITMREKEAEEMAKRVAAITGKPETLPVTNPQLALRARKVERVSSSRFPEPDAMDNFRAIISQGAAAGMMPMGRLLVKRAAVNIVVDEKGDVTEAKIADNSLKNAAEIEAAAKKSKFRPFSYNGVSQKMRGTLIYPYFDN
jgi:tetratricopeptide (TPR) repeat protein